MEKKYYCPHCEAIIPESETEEAAVSINPYAPDEVVKLPFRRCKRLGCGSVVVLIPEKK